LTGSDRFRSDFADLGSSVAVEGPTSMRPHAEGDIAMRTKVAGIAIAALLTSLAPAVTQPASAALSSLRQNTVDRAKAALNNPRNFRLVSGGTVYASVPASGYNYLGKNGSNANRNEFNDYNGLAWCGYFAAAIWTGTNTPNPANFPRIPTDYPSSQAWRTETGSSYHKFSALSLPSPADVVVWQDGSGTAGVSNGSATGHVGVVISVNFENMTITTIEGNTGPYSDSIKRNTYAWDSNGPTISGKHFMGYVDRE
jgi:hypothetical protein